MFITIDGPDGSGKTTIAKELVKALDGNGQPAVYTAEPTNSPLGMQIRRILREGGAGVHELTRLFVQDRADHVRDFILPWQAEGKVVVCDRYKYSTVCYQQLQGDTVSRLLELNGPFPAPDIAFVLLADQADILLARIQRRGQVQELFETKATILKSFQIYKNMREYYPQENIVYLDAAQETSCTVEQMLRLILRGRRPA